jgi:hypothetical protein
MFQTTNSISVDSVKSHTYKPEIDQAQVRQTVSAAYPVRKINNELFDIDEFGLEERTYESIRVTWLDVPKGTTPEQVLERMNKYPNARIQRILSSEPIFTTDEKKAKLSDVIDDEQWANMQERQKVRNTEGAIVEFNGKPQYRRYKLSLQGEADIDQRIGGTPETAPMDENIRMEVGEGTPAAVDAVETK